MAYTAKDLRIQPVGFVFNAETYLRSVLPAGWDAKRLLSIKNNTIEETQLLTQALGNMRAMGLTNMADIRTSIKDFSKKYGTGLANTKKSTKLPHGQDLLRNRVEGALLYDNAVKMTTTQVGRAFRWLPSDAKEPRHKHMLRYGKVFVVGDGQLPDDDDFPGKAYGCKCSYEWVDEQPSDYIVGYEDNVKQYKLRKRSMKIDSDALEHYLLKMIQGSLTGSLRSRASKAITRNYGGTSMIRSVQWWQDHNTATARVDLSKPAKSPTEQKVREDLSIPYNYLKLPKATTMYSGKSIMHVDFSKLKVGSKIYLKSPTFVSQSKSVAQNFARNKNVPVIWQFNLRRGTRVFPSQLVSSYPNEREMLLAPLSGFRIVKIIGAKSRLPIIVLESITSKGGFVGVNI